MKHVISILLGEQPDILENILNFYKPKGGTILDLTFGSGKLWKPSVLQKYDMVGIDKDRKVKPYVYADLLHLPFIFKFDLILYDPPYKYNTDSYIFFGRPDPDWKSERTLWSVADQIRNLEGLNTIIPGYLKDDGIFLIKIMDTRFDGTLVPNHFLCMKHLNNLKLFDILIYVRLMVGVFTNPSVSQTAHGFYLVFKRKLEEK